MQAGHGAALAIVIDPRSCSRCRLHWHEEVRQTSSSSNQTLKVAAVGGIGELLAAALIHRHGVPPLVPAVMCMQCISSEGR
jgi:hypothetical protein